MVNLSTWLTELLFAVLHTSFSLAEPLVERLVDIKNLTIPAVINNRIDRYVYTPPAWPFPTTKTTTTHAPFTVFSIHTLKPDTPPPPICLTIKIDYGKYLSADCTNKKLSKIPHDFGVKNYPLIKILDISNNNLKQLNSTDLYNFTSLTELVMKDIPDFHSFPKDFFLHSQYLEKLDISGTPISDYGELNIYLRILNGTNTKAKNVNLSHLVSLEELYLKDNPEIANFPLLSLTAPLKHLDVRFNSMINLTYADLAPFCLLNYFGLESSELEKASNATACCGIKNWTMFFKIPGSENQKCGPGDPCLKINSTLNLDAVGVRNECLKRTGFFEFVKTVIEIFIGVVVTSGVLYFICYNYCFSHGGGYYDDYDYYDRSYASGQDYYYDDDDDDDDDGGGGDDYDEEDYYY